MMKMNLLAGLVGVILLSACSSQRIASGNEITTNSSVTPGVSSPTQSPKASKAPPAVKNMPAQASFEVVK